MDHSAERRSITALSGKLRRKAEGLLGRPSLCRFTAGAGGLGR